MLISGIFNSRNDFLKSFAAFLFLAVTLYFFSIGNYYNSDEGTILNGAWRMYWGDELYTDFFSYIAPGSYWWTWLSFLVFGPSYFSARFFSIIILTASVLAVFRITMLAGGRTFSALSAASAWLLMNVLNVVLINHNNHSSYFASIAILFAVAAMVFGRKTYFVLAGLFVGITAVFLQTKGIALAAGLGVPVIYYSFFGNKEKSKALWFVLGCLTLPAAIFFIWDPAFLYETLISWPREHYLEVNNISKVLWFATVAVALVVSYLAFRIRNQLNSGAIFVLVSTEFFMLLAALTRPDFSHIMLASFGLIVLSALVLEKYLEVPSDTFGVDQEIFKKIAVFALCFSAFFRAVLLGHSALASESFFNELLGRYRSEKIYAHPFAPGYYFDLGSPSPYYYDLLLTGMYPDEAFAKNLLQLKQENPDYVFVNYDAVSKFNYSRANALDLFISENYEPENSAGPLKILKKK